MDEFDVVVIGAGPAGEAAAGRCADGGLSVALVERELVGGECPYWGCVPSKTLIRPGDLLAAARRVPGVREAVTRGVDVAAALAQRDYMTSGWKGDGQLLPRRLLVLGGGAVGVEMAQAARRLGCDEVTVIEGAPRLLAREERSPARRCAAAWKPKASQWLSGPRFSGSAGKAWTARSSYSWTMKVASPRTSCAYGL